MWQQPLAQQLNVAATTGTPTGHGSNHWYTNCKFHNLWGKMGGSHEMGMCVDRKTEEG
jgi:hypothetical protein